MAITITSCLASHPFAIRTDFFIPNRSSVHTITIEGLSIYTKNLRQNNTFHYSLREKAKSNFLLILN